MSAQRDQHTRRRVRLVAGSLVVGLVVATMWPATRSFASAPAYGTVGNGGGRSATFCTYNSVDHVKALSGTGSFPDPPADATWNNNFDKANSSTLEQNMASQILEKMNVERAANADNPGNPVYDGPIPPLNGSGSSAADIAALTEVAKQWVDCQISEGPADWTADDPNIVADDDAAGYAASSRGYEENTGFTGATTDSSVAGYMGSPPHATNLLNPYVNEVGVAIACTAGGVCIDDEEFGTTTSITSIPTYTSTSQYVHQTTTGGTATTAVLAPAPTIDSEVGGVGTCTVTWTPGSVSAAQPPDRTTGYVLLNQESGDSVAAVAPGSSTSYRISGLSPGEYAFDMKAENDIGPGALRPDPGGDAGTCVVPSSGGGHLPPSTPRDVAAQADDASAFVTWEAPASQGSSSITDYVVMTEPGGATETVPATSIQVEVAGLTNGVTYHFLVAAENSDGTSPTASSNDVTPSTSGASCGAQGCVPPGAAATPGPVVAMAATFDGGGYLLVTAKGFVYAFGDAHFCGSEAYSLLTKPIVGIAPTPKGGYWLVASDGGIFSFGPGVHFYGSEGGHHLNRPIVGMEALPNGTGYRMVAADGGIFDFGAARFFGSMGGTHLNQPIVGMATSPKGGYWLVASDGGIFSFGPGVHFYGSEGGTHLNQPIVEMEALAAGNGYRMVAADGGIFDFGAAHFYGSAVGKLGSPAAGMASTSSGAGYWVADETGQVIAFGGAGHFGSV